MDITPITNWAYEHRFECCVRGSLLAVPPTLWSTAFSLAQCSIESHGKTPQCHYYLLDSGFLVVFHNRCVFVSSTRVGLIEAATYLLGALAEKQPTHASLTRRYPVGEDLLSLAVSGLDESQLPPITATLESGTVHEWSLEPSLASGPPQTLTLLFHGLVDSSDSDTCRSAVWEIFPDFLTVVHKPRHDCFTVIAISGTQYIALRRTESTYANLEVSVSDWYQAERLISQALLLFKPEIVAPIWTGAPIENSLGYSSSNDDRVRPPGDQS